MESGYVNLKNYNQNILVKAKEYESTMRAKQTIFHYKGYDGILEMRGGDHPIRYGDVMSLSHLISLICYTDFSDLCTAWTSTFRQIVVGESRQSMDLRLMCYHHLSKYLYL